MPWTFAHPAAALALRGLGRGRLPLAALCVGSLAPDFGYYVGQFGFATLAHTFAGLFLVCLPAGALALFLTRLLRRPVCFLLPQPHRGAIATLPEIGVFTSAEAALAGAASILLGALSHIVWDSFTHASGWAVSHIHPLQRELIGSAPAYHVLQHASTVLGVAVLVFAYMRWLRKTAIGPAPAQTERWRIALLGGLAALAIAIAVPFALIHAASFDGYFAVRAFMFRAVVIGTIAFATLLVGCGLFLERKSNTAVRPE